MTNGIPSVHATTVAIDGRGVMIVGPSGSGKSALAVQLIALGAVLVADDQTVLATESGAIVASAPAAISGLIEARGVGIIPVGCAPQVPVHLVVDMAQVETKRLPDVHSYPLHGVTLPCLHKVDSGHFPSALILYMKAQP